MKGARFMRDSFKLRANFRFSPEAMQALEELRAMNPGRTATELVEAAIIAKRDAEFDLNLMMRTHMARQSRYIWPD